MPIAPRGFKPNSAETHSIRRKPHYSVQAHQTSTGAPNSMRWCFPITIRHTGGVSDDDRDGGEGDDGGNCRDEEDMRDDHNANVLLIVFRCQEPRLQVSISATASLLHAVSC